MCETNKCECECEYCSVAILLTLNRGPLGDYLARSIDSPPFLKFLDADKFFKKPIYYDYVYLNEQNNDEEENEDDEE